MPPNSPNELLYEGDNAMETDQAEVQDDYGVEDPLNSTNEDVDIEGLGDEGKDNQEIPEALHTTNDSILLEGHDMLNDTA